MRLQQIKLNNYYRNFSIMNICIPYPCINNGGMCIPNSTTEVWTMVDVDLLIDISMQFDHSHVCTLLVQTFTNTLPRHLKLCLI